MKTAALLTKKLSKFGLDSRVSIYPQGKIQVSYSFTPKLRKTMKLVKRCLVPLKGKNVELREGELSFDPLDLSVELTRTDNWLSSGSHYFIAKVPVYTWLDKNTGELVYRIPNRQGKVNISGTNCSKARKRTPTSKQVALHLSGWLYCISACY